MSRAALPTRYAQADIPISPTFGNVACQYLKRFTDTTGVTITGTGVSSSIATAPTGETCLMVTTGVGNTADIEIAQTIAPPITGHIVFTVYVNDPDDTDYFRVFVSQGNYAGWAQMDADVYAASGTAYRQYRGWHQITINNRTKTDAGTGNDFSSQTTDKMKLRIVPNAGKSVTVYIHSYALVARARPKWVLSFDDNRTDLLTAVWTGTLRGTAGTYSLKQILDAYGYRGTLYLVGDIADQNYVPGITWAQIKSLQDSGWDVAYQIYANCASDINEGARLMGSTGYTLKSVASVDTTANTITSSAVHNLPSSTSYRYPINFVGTDLPSPLTTSGTYYAKYSSTTAFTLHPTEADAAAGTNTIDLTTTGTAANFQWRYAGSSPDHTSILADLVRLRDTAADYGINLINQIAPNQGALDKDVYDAFAQHGLKIIRTTLGETSSNFSFVPHDFWPTPRPLSMVNFFDSASTQAAVEATIDAVIQDGTIGFGFQHVSGGQNLAWVCDYLYRKMQQGAVDVCKISELDL